MPNLKAETTVENTMMTVVISMIVRKIFLLTPRTIGFVFLFYSTFDHVLAKVADTPFQKVPVYTNVSVSA